MQDNKRVSQSGTNKVKTHEFYLGKIAGIFFNFLHMKKLANFKFIFAIIHLKLARKVL